MFTSTSVEHDGIEPKRFNKLNTTHNLQLLFQEISEQEQECLRGGASQHDVNWGHFASGAYRFKVEFTPPTL